MYSQIEYLKHSPYFKEEMWQFMVVAQEKNISRAAEYLGISQPQLSKSMSALEAQLGTKIFMRRSRGVELTLTGQSLLQSLERIALSLSTVDKGTQFSTVQIGFHHSIAMQVYPKVIHQLNLSQGAPRVELRLATSLEVTRMVAELKLDFGFVINPQKNPDVVAKKLEQDKISVYMSAKGQNTGILYYHPSMINVHRFLKRLKDYKHIPLPDYEVIAQTIATNNSCAGILPTRIGNRYGLNEMPSNALFTVDLVIIAHKDRLRFPAMKNLFNQMHTLFTET